MRFLERHGFGVRVGPENLSATLHELLADPARLARMGAAAREQGVRDGAERIADLIRERAGRPEPVARWAAP